MQRMARKAMKMLLQATHIALSIQMDSGADSGAILL